MLKKDLIAEVAEATQQDESLVRQIFDATTTAVLTTLAGGGSVMLLALGKLSVHRRSAKKARHMTSGAAMMVPARNVVRLRPSVGVNAVVNADQPLA